MIEPSFDRLLEKVGGKYTLVMVAAKRARRILNEGKAKSGKPVSISLREIVDDKLKFERS